MACDVATSATLWRMDNYIDIVFDGPPGPNADGHHCNFVEVENPDGSGARVGEWIDRGNGLWALRIPEKPMNWDHRDTDVVGR